MPLDVLKLKNVANAASIFVNDIGLAPKGQPPYHYTGQAKYLPFNTVVSVFRDGAVETSLASGMLQKLIAKGKVVIVP